MIQTGRLPATILRTPTLIRVAPAEPDVMIYSDVDDSLMTADEVGLQHSRDAMNQHASHTVVGMATGRGLIYAKKNGPRLGGFPMAFFATNHGQSLFINRLGKPADQFIHDLKQEDEDPDWALHVADRSNGWSVARVHKRIRDEALKLGMQPAPELPAPLESYENYTTVIPTAAGPQRLMLCLPADQPSFQIRSLDGQPFSKELCEFGEALAADVQRACGWGYNHYPPINGKVIHFFQPPGITKRGLLQYQLAHYPSVRNVITIGDNVNDDMLDAERYGNVLNYPLLARDGHPHESELVTRPRLELQKGGDMGPGILDQMGRIAANRREV